MFTATGVPLPANGPRTVSVLSVEPWRFLSALPPSTLPLPALSLLLRSVMLARAGSLDYRMAHMGRMRVEGECAQVLDSKDVLCDFLCPSFELRGGSEVKAS